MKASTFIASLVLAGGTFLAPAQESLARAATRPTTQASSQSVGERVPSEDPVLKDFHCLGLFNGRVDIFRCASPVHDLGTPTTSPSDAVFQAEEAKSRIRHLYSLGIRTAGLRRFARARPVGLLSDSLDCDNPRMYGGVRFLGGRHAGIQPSKKTAKVELRPLF